MSYATAAGRVSAVLFVSFLVSAIPGTDAVAQERVVPDVLDVVGGNSSNSRMFWLNYDPDDHTINEAIQVNTATDASKYPSLNSFSFLRDSCGSPRVDVIAASTNASQLVIYEGGKGDGTPICGPGHPGACPARPVGLATSTGQLVAVATSGAAGSTPGVFTFAPGEQQCTTFNRRGGNLSVDGVRNVRAIADTDYVLQDGGGLAEGDLLVLVGNPAMIVRVAPAGIAAGGATGSVFAGSDSAFGRATPTGIAVVPGDEPNVLVTLSTGEIINFYYRDNAWQRRELDGSRGMFPNPRGIAAGTRSDETYMVVSEQNQGRYIRATLAPHPAGGLSASEYRTVFSPVGAPQGIAINSEDLFLLQCFQPVTEPDGTTGCPLHGSIQLHFSRGFEPDWPPRGGRVEAELTFIPDPQVNPLRQQNGGFLPLDNGFVVPPYCRGFETDQPQFGGVPQLVLIDVDINFAVKPANFVVVTELAQELLGLEGDCKDTGSRIYYHPSGPGGTMFDTTFSCQNPSRSIVENFSPVLLCSDTLHLDRVATGDVFFMRNEFNAQIRPRLDSLKADVDALPELGVDSGLVNTLKGLLVSFTNPDMRSISAADLREYFLDTSRKADDGALVIFELKKLGTFGDPAFVPQDPGSSELQGLYGRLLRGFLSLAFYASETGALVEYKPPNEFCQEFTYRTFVNGVETFVDADYELPDVECAAPREGG